MGFFLLRCCNVLSHHSWFIHARKTMSSSPAMVVDNWTIELDTQSYPLAGLSPAARYIYPCRFVYLDHSSSILFIRLLAPASRSRTLFSFIILTTFFCACSSFPGFPRNWSK